MCIFYAENIFSSHVVLGGSKNTALIQWLICIGRQNICFLRGIEISFSFERIPSLSGPRYIVPVGGRPIFTTSQMRRHEHVEIYKLANNTALRILHEGVTWKCVGVGKMQDQETRSQHPDVGERLSMMQEQFEAEIERIGKER